MSGIELIGYGNVDAMGLVSRWFGRARDPIVLVRFIWAKGGLAIGSNRSRYGYEIPPALVGEINGIEVWNASNDSRFVPDRRGMDLWRGLREHNQGLAAFGGQGLHRITPQRQGKHGLCGPGGGFGGGGSFLWF